LSSTDFLHDLDLERTFETVAVDTVLSNLLRKEVSNTVDFTDIEARTILLHGNLKNNLKSEEVKNLSASGFSITLPRRLKVDLSTPVLNSCRRSASSYPGHV